MNCRLRGPWSGCSYPLRDQRSRTQKCRNHFSAAPVARFTLITDNNVLAVPCTADFLVVFYFIYLLLFVFTYVLRVRCFSDKINSRRRQ